MEAIFHSHAFIEIETKSWSILIDPFITWNPISKIGLEDILKKKILAVIVSHWHSDHIWDTVDIAQKTGCLVVSTFEVINYFQNFFKLENTHPMHIWWEFLFSFGKIKLVTAIHWWGIWPECLWGTPAWIMLEIDWKTIYHAWDTALTYDMKLLESRNIDLAFLPIWDNFTMWIDDAVIATGFIKPKVVVPIHFNTFEMIKQDPQEFAEKVMLSWNSVCKVLLPWQSYVFSI